MPEPMPDRQPANPGDVPGTGSASPTPESLENVLYNAFLQQQEHMRGQVDYAGRLAAVLDVQQEITSSEPPLEEVLSLVAKRAVAILGATGAAIAVECNGTMICRASSGATGPEIGARLAGNTGLSGECLRTGKITVCSDSDTDPRVDTDAAHALGIRSMVVAPLFHHRSTVGIFEVFSAKPYFFESEDAHIVELLGGLITTAISYSSEFEAKQTLESERTAMLQVLEQIKPTIEKMLTQQSEEDAEGSGEGGFQSEEIPPSATASPAQYMANLREMPAAVPPDPDEAAAEEQRSADADSLARAEPVASDEEAGEDEPLPEPPEFPPRRGLPVPPLPSDFSSPPSFAAQNARQQQALTSAFEVLMSKEGLLVPEPEAPLPAPPDDFEGDDLDLPEPEPPPSPRISVGQGAPGLQEKSKGTETAVAAPAHAPEAVAHAVSTVPAEVVPTLPSAPVPARPSPFTGWAKNWGATVRHWMAGKREPGQPPTAETTGVVQAVPAFHLPLRWRNLMEYAIPAILTGLLIVVGLEWLSSERMVVPYWGHSGALRTPTPSLGGTSMLSTTPVEISSYMSPTAIGLAHSGKNVIEGVKSAVGTGTASSDWRGGIGKLGSKLGAVTVTDSSLPGKGAPAISGVQNVIPDIRSSSNSVTLPSNANPGQQAPQEQVTTVRVSEDVLEKFLLVRVQPVYPAIAREKGITGAVVLRTTIARDGSVREVRAVSGNRYLAESALTAISQWRYKPFVLDGKPVQVATEIRVVFKRR